MAPQNQWRSKINVTPRTAPPYAGRTVEGIINVDRPIPGDLKIDPKQYLEKRFFQDFLAVNKIGNDLSNEQLVKQILRYLQILTSLDTVGLAFLPRVVPVVTAPTELIARNRFPRGYRIQNPAEVAGSTSQITFFPSALRANFTTPSATFAVSAIETLAFWLDITARTGVPLTTFDVETQDPLTGKFAVAQADIFSGANTVGTRYVFIGTLGVDRNVRIAPSVTGGGTDLTFSLSGLGKGNGLTPIGSTIYIGGPDVNTTIGYTILPGEEKKFYLLENVSMFAITATDTLNCKVFQTM